MWRYNDFQHGGRPPSWNCFITIRDHPRSVCCWPQLPVKFHVNLIHRLTPTRSLRSSSQLLLQTNPTRTVLSRRGFSSSAPRAWNSLGHVPDKLRSCTAVCSTLDTFRRTLKHTCSASPLMPRLGIRAHD